MVSIYCKNFFILIYYNIFSFQALKQKYIRLSFYNLNLYLRILEKFLKKKKKGDKYVHFSTPSLSRNYLRTMWMLHKQSVKRMFWPEGHILCIYLIVWEQSRLLICLWWGGFWRNEGSWDWGGSPERDRWGACGIIKKKKKSPSPFSCSVGSYFYTKGSPIYLWIGHISISFWWRFGSVLQLSLYKKFFSISFGHIIKEITSMVSSLRAHSSSHTRRQSNSMAHTLVKRT